MPPRTLAVYRCKGCGAQREQDADRPIPPQCGQTFTDRTRFGDGSWVEVITHTTHGAMEKVGELSGNPFQKEADERAAALAEKARSLDDCLDELQEREFAQQRAEGEEVTNADG